MSWSTLSPNISTRRIGREVTVRIRVPKDNITRLMHGFDSNSLTDAVEDHFKTGPLRVEFFRILIDDGDFSLEIQFIDRAKP